MKERRQHGPPPAGAQVRWDLRNKLARRVAIPVASVALFVASLWAWPSVDWGVLAASAFGCVLTVSAWTGRIVVADRVLYRRWLWVWRTVSLDELTGMRVSYMENRWYGRFLHLAYPPDHELTIPLHHFSGWQPLVVELGAAVEANGGTLTKWARRTVRRAARPPRFRRRRPSPMDSTAVSARNDDAVMDRAQP